MKKEKINYDFINNDKLPPYDLYRKYLNIASIRFSMTIDECRNKFGLFTN